MARSAAAEDGSIRGAVVRNLAAALGLVLVVAAAFTFIGAAEPAANGAGPTEDAGAAEEPGGEPEDPPAPVLEPENGPSEDDVAPFPEDAEPEEPESLVPEDISVQVLDGYREDGGTAASGVVDELEAAGFRVVAENPAIPYDETAVFWASDAFEEEARMVAEALGVTDVREQPGNLSANVAVHVVVGADRAG